MASALPSFISRLIRPFSSSTSLGLSPGGPVSAPEGAAKATVAAGCFWGVEHMYRKEFTGKGLYDARVGYIGGDAKNPSYRSVCSGATGRTCPHFPAAHSGKNRKKKKGTSANA
jgi:peptide-methionine (S)-S-oxide reductase